jgi:hypothetical protein
MPKNWINGRRKLFADALCFSSRRARRTWKRRSLSGRIAGMVSRWSDRTEVLDEHDRRCEQSRSHAVQALQGCAERRDLHRFHEASRRGRAALVKDAQQKIFLIVDNLRVHHAKAVQDWLVRHKDEIEIFYLPAYAMRRNTT